jgi:hypothetical protein
MTFLSLCNTCLESFLLTVAPGDADLVKQVESAPGLCPCPRRCGGMINTAMMAEFEHMQGRSSLTKNPIEISAKDLYGAVYGNGLPDEIPTDPMVVDALLRANQIVGTDVEKVGGAVYIHGLKLSNGLAIHLSGGMGPRVVKITKPLPEVADGVPSGR